MAELPDIESLQLLVLVGRRGSLTAAASEAGVSQPAASKRISRLERRLGVRLLARTRRGSTLTAAGELVTGWAERVLDDLDVLVEGTAALRRESSGHLTVAASLTVAEHLLPTWLGELRRSAPELHVGLQVTNSSRVCDLVRDAVVDLGFIESPGSLRGLRSHAVADDRVAIYRLHWRGRRVLFVNDAGWKTERRLLDAGLDLRADVLVAGRHRTDGSLGDEFLAAVSPRAIIAGDAGFPPEERLDPAKASRWRQLGIAVFDQRETGGVTIRPDEDQLRIEGFLNGQTVKLSAARDLE